MYEKIPQELKKYNNWVCWQAYPDPREDDPDHIGKKPVDPSSGKNASSTDPKTWSDFETAVKASEKFNGIGFVFTNSPFFGVDLDKISDDIESYRQGGDGIVSEFLCALGSYAELSVSGKGIHIICRGSLPENGRRKNGSVEMYETGRFFTMSGKAISDLPIADCTESIKPLHKKYLGNKQKKESPAAERTAITDETINSRLQKAYTSRQGALLSDLMQGSWQGAYKSQSEADLALCNILAFWLGKDFDAIDSVFRSSGLMREKWDRKTGSSTYGAMTVTEAINGCKEVYNESRKTVDDYYLTIGADGETAVTDTEGHEVKRYTLDDTGNAERLVDNFGERLHYSYPNKTWYYWDDRRWQPDETGTIKRVADAAIDLMNDEIAIYQRLDEQSGEIKLDKAGNCVDGNLTIAFRKHIRATRSSKSKNAMITEAQHRVSIMPNDFDRFKFLLNAKNGVIDLAKDRIIPHDKQLLITKLAGSEIAETADCPLWEKFLNDIFCGDRDLIRYIQKAAGYSLSGSTQEQCVFFLFGNGSNGKSTFLEIIRAMMGDYCVNAQVETLMTTHKASGAASSDIARLKGARLVTANEPNEGMRLDEGLIKQLTGGDTVTARFQYASEFEFTPEFKIWLATNHRPIIRGTDNGIWRRIRLIPFSAQLDEGKKDIALPRKLRAELPAILRWAVDGYNLYKQEGLRMPKAVKQSVDEYRTEMDVISMFLQACCSVGGGSEASSTLYAVYCRWAADNNEYTMSHTKFTAELAKREGINRERRKSGSFITGLTLQDWCRNF